MNMMGYVCEQCPLAFEVGYYGYWDIKGLCVHYVCRHCGTMHKIVHWQNEHDQLFAIAGPIPSMVEETVTLSDGTTHQMTVLPISEGSWRYIDSLPTHEKYMPKSANMLERVQAVNLSALACTHCLRAGGLVSKEWPLALNGTWPAFGDSCPVCEEKLVLVYINQMCYPSREPLPLGWHCSSS